MLRFSLTGGFSADWVMPDGIIGKARINTEKCLTLALNVIINTDKELEGLLRLYSRSSAIPKPFLFK